MMARIWKFFKKNPTRFRDTELANGWGMGIQWVHQNEAFGSRYSTGKPIIQIVHKPGDASSENFKKMFAQDKEIQALARYFVMVNCEAQDKVHHVTRQEMPYPQIQFFSSRNLLLTGMYCLENPTFPYFYSEVTHLKLNMRKLLLKRGMDKTKLDQLMDL